MELIINGSEIRSKSDFHNTLKRDLNLPEYYGENLDALWDCLTGWVEMPLTIKWLEFDTCNEILDGYALKILELFHDVENEIQGFEIICPK